MEPERVNERTNDRYNEVSSPMSKDKNVQSSLNL